MAREAFASGTTAMGPDVNDPFEILGVRRDRARKIAPEDLRAAFRQRAKEAHPDKGGDADSFQRLKKAFDDALAELSATVAAKGSAPQYDWRRGRTAENARPAPKTTTSTPRERPSAPVPRRDQKVSSRTSHRGTNLEAPRLVLSGCAVDGASSPVVSVATSPGGNFVATASLGGGVRLFDSRTGVMLGAYTRECRAKASSSRRVLQGAVGVWFGPCGMPLVAAFTDGSLAAWRINCDESRHLRSPVELLGHTHRVTAACFADSNVLCTASADSTARVWNLAEMWNSREVTSVELVGHDGALTCCAVSSGGDGLPKLLATCDARGAFCVWSMGGDFKKLYRVRWNAGGCERSNAGGFDDGIVKCLWMPRSDDSEYLATAHVMPQHNSSRVLVWRVPPRDAHGRKGRDITGYAREFPGKGRELDGRITDMVLAAQPTKSKVSKRDSGSSDDSSEDSSDDDDDGFLEDGVLVLSGSRGWIRGTTCMDGKTMSPLWSLTDEHSTLGSMHAVHRVAVAPSGARFASGGEDGTVRVWDSEDATAMGTFGHVSENRGRVWSIAWSEDESFLLVGYAGGTAALWNVPIEMR